MVNIFIFLIYGLPSSLPKYGLWGDLAFFILALVLYFVAGFKLAQKILNQYDSSLRNISSVILIFVLGLLIWAYKFLADIWWIFGFYLFNYYAVPLYPLFEHFHYGNPLELVDLQIIFSFLPVLMIWLGMELDFKKRNVETKKFDAFHGC